VVTLALSPDGRTIVSGSNDYTVKLWDLASGRELRTLIVYEAGRQGQDFLEKNVSTVAFSPDSKSVIAGNVSEVKMWDVATGREIRRFGESDRDGAGSVAFTRDGKTLAAGSFSGKVQLWDTSTGKRMRVFDSGGADAIYGVSFSRDGKLLVAGSQFGAVDLWDVNRGQLIRSLHTMKEATGITVFDVAFSEDANFVFAGFSDGTIKVWDAKTGKTVRILPVYEKNGRHAQFGHFSLTADGKTLASAGAGVPSRLLDLGSGRELRTLGSNFSQGEQNEAPTNELSDSESAIAVAADGKLVVSGGEAGGTLKIWDAKTGKKLKTLGGGGREVRSVAFSPDGGTIAAADGSKNLVLWRLSDGRASRTAIPAAAGRPFVDGAVGVTFSPDGHTAISVAHHARLVRWDVETGLAAVNFPPFDAHYTLLKGASAFSRDGKLMVFAPPSLDSADFSARIIDVASNAIVQSLAREAGDRTQSVAISTDGRTVATGSGRATFKLWEISTGKELASAENFDDNRSSIESLAFAQGSELLAIGRGDGTLELWDVVSHKPSRLKGSHGGAVTSLAYSNDGKILVSGSKDLTLKLWDVASGAELHTLKGHEGEVTSLALSPDGKFVISGSDDETIRLWSVAAGDLLATLTMFDDGNWAVADPQGRFDTANLERMPYLHWVIPDDPLTPLPLEIFMRVYYEPRLLSRILNGEVFNPVPPMAKLNRVQPEVRIIGIQAVPGNDREVDVNVEAYGASRRYQPGAKPVVTAVHDLRLLRNGQLVGYDDRRLAEAGNTPFHRTHRVRLPAGSAAVSFSAYAFNNDRVKSATAEFTYVPVASVQVTRPNAYIITVGVSHNERHKLDLDYAANDARLLSESVVRRLIGQDRYRDIVPISLISDAGGPMLATKAKLKAVLDRLAGRGSDVSDIPNAERLHQVAPEDMVLISFSGHGVDVDGLFYLIPSDTGVPSDKTSSQEDLSDPVLLAHSISTDELESWLRDVDGGDIVLIIDACHSAASVDSGFKPGPMGDHGLGQLAYEKGIRILAASQAQESAGESSLTQQGFLSFALVHDGLERNKADFKPKDQKITLAEWLSYGMERVPGLADEVARGALGTGNVTAKPTEIGARGNRRKRLALQQPALFDFTNGRRDPTITSAVAGQ
jgi:WD40 repeat protein/uncharacterized caspase-like protein